MAYTPTVFVDRSVEFPGRRVLTEVVGSADTFDVTRAEGTEFAVGTLLDAVNLNAEFDKIQAETDAIRTVLSAEWTLIGTATGTTQINFVKEDWKELKIRILPNTAGAGLNIVLEKQIDSQFLSDTRNRYGNEMTSNYSTNSYAGMMIEVTTTYAKLLGLDVYTNVAGLSTATIQLYGK